MGPGDMEKLLQFKMAEICRYLIRLGAEAADAEDIVQDTVYKALLYLEAIDERKFSAWLYKVAINRYYDFCRKQKRFLYSEEVDEQAVQGSEMPEAVLLRQEEKELIEFVLAKLSPVNRQLILLKYEMELSYKEIAALLGISEGKVKATLYRARQQFQQLYGGEGE
ncbi:RNA polymerase sigma factor [Paenibacillus sp. S150]|uniref:RNA polymerase sigma factor n=1 Tax=Paenibacillus sp. S150 TaxID=2749826 RepID=UPI001C5852B5|nr:sigma-70 family RNA polymerase sigma factor [Paenibacillus sp. S150]MBW4083304.1 sigma-70 family RNA polymerase sigma factor [Paenibacillus sp. S150]